MKNIHKKITRMVSVGLAAMLCLSGPGSALVSAAEQEDASIAAAAENSQVDGFFLQCRSTEQSSSTGSSFAEVDVHGQAGTDAGSAEKDAASTTPGTVEEPYCHGTGEPEGSSERTDSTCDEDEDSRSEEGTESLSDSEKKRTGTNQSTEEKAFIDASRTSTGIQAEDAPDSMDGTQAGTIEDRTVRASGVASDSPSGTNGETSVSVRKDAGVQVSTNTYFYNRILGESHLSEEVQNQIKDVISQILKIDRTNPNSYQSINIERYIPDVKSKLNTILKRLRTLRDDAYGNKADESLFDTCSIRLAEEKLLFLLGHVEHWIKSEQMSECITWLKEVSFASKGYSSDEVRTAGIGRLTIQFFGIGYHDTGQEIEDRDTRQKMEYRDIEQDIQDSGEYRQETEQKQTMNESGQKQIRNESRNESGQKQIRNEAGQKQIRNESRNESGQKQTRNESGQKQTRNDSRNESGNETGQKQTRNDSRNGSDQRKDFGEIEEQADANVPESEKGGKSGTDRDQEDISGKSMDRNYETERGIPEEDKDNIHLSSRQARISGVLFRLEKSRGPTCGRKKQLRECDVGIGLGLSGTRKGSICMKPNIDCYQTQVLLNSRDGPLMCDTG